MCLGKIKQESEDEELSDEMEMPSSSRDLEVDDYDSSQSEEKPEVAKSPLSKKKRFVFSRVQKKTLLVRFKIVLL
jgi:hypothetical protein